MNKPLIVLILTLLFLGSCEKDKYDDYQQKIVGTWEDTDGFTWYFIDSGYLVYLKDDGHDEYREYGYTIEENKLSLILPNYWKSAGLTQTFFIKISADGKTLNLKMGPYVPGWEAVGRGWDKNKLTKTSDNVDEYIEMTKRLREDLFGEEKDETESLVSDNLSFNESYLALNDLSFNDRYGNLLKQYDFREKINYSLLFAPDIDLLLQIKNKLITFTIDNKSLKDISFLKNLPQIKELFISSSNISSLEPVKYLENLEILNIAGGFSGIIDCSVFRDLKNLKTLDLNDNEIENIGEIYKIDNYNYHLKVKGIKGYEDYIEKYHSLSNSESYVFHYDKYHIMQSGVNIKARPSESSNTVAELNLHDEIQIIEYTDKEEKINDIWGYWYKIKHKNVTGYIFGGYIAAEALITDIDKNGIKDYFYLRHHTSDWDVDPNKDILIYINNQKIDTSVLSKSKRYLDRRFNDCEFEERKGYVLVILIQYGREDSEFRHEFKVLPNGKIEFITNWDYWW